MDRVKYLAGLFFAKLSPQKVEEIRNSFTIPNYWFGHLRGHIIERLIRYYVGYTVKRQERENQGVVEAIHKNFWRQTDKYFSTGGNRTKKVYIPAYNDVVKDMQTLLVDRDIQTVCEFGAGDGTWLNYLYQQWAGVKEFIGIDISLRQIEKNKEIYKHLTFIQSDILEWATTNATPNTLYHTNGGVLEYLSEVSVKQLLKTLKDQAKSSIVFFIEPLHGSYDINKNFTTQIIGYEHSYTHNYVYLLGAEGIEIIRHEEREVLGYRMLIVLAYIGK